MAKVLNPLNSTEARGRVGGLVYNTWRGIRTVKTHRDPDHEDDPKRVAHKLIVQAAGIRWRSLTDAQRAAWELFASEHPDQDWRGSPVRLAGYHWYVRVQTRRQDISQGYHDAPPAEPCSQQITGLTLQDFDPDLNIYWDPILPLGPPHYYIDLWWVPLHSPGRTPSLHDAVRFTYWDARDGSNTISQPGYGTYTIFARSINLNGLTGTWARARILLEPQE